MEAWPAMNKTILIGVNIFGIVPLIKDPLNVSNTANIRPLNVHLSFVLP